MCNGIKIVWLVCAKHSQNKPKNGQKPAIFRLFSIFSKTVHTIRTKFCSYSTPYSSPKCAMVSKSYGWDVRNIAKISPKMAKKQPFSDFSRFSQKLSIRFERNFVQLFYIIFESYMCKGIKIVWLGCEKHSQNYSKNGEKNPFFDFFRLSQTVHTIRTKFSTVILHHIRVLYVQWYKNRMAGM